MNNKTILECVLTLTKSLNSLYLDATVESSNPDVRKLYQDGLKNTLAMQDEIYQAMKSDGMYDVANVKESEIKKIYNKLIKDES